MQAGKGLRAPKLCRWNFAEPGIREQHEGVLWLLCGYLSLSKFFRDGVPRFIGQSVVEEGSQTYNGDFRNTFAQWFRRFRQCRRNFCAQ
jgi:hypothetical protein